ncbi:MAG TPA: Asp-tRNA(Asn)/Glu-tRNA(Gln) amidotransferase subunit GatA [Gemmatimonadaceae bacterium]|nr:Asp-tRNA(Asn)/Glu-tRNA(Gln) amidotransferase subunit GatA [Gemmatimonadaceae bacterium]
MSGNHPASDAVRMAFDRMVETKAGRDGMNWIVWSDRDWSLDLAKEADEHTGGALAGIPFAVKDNIATHHLPTTCASRILEGYVSAYEATVVKRMREAGAVLVGKTNCDEFAMGSSNENSAYGPARNPVDPTRVTGGSSGGSAAVVAAGIVPIALGSETGGSVRQPAAFTGVVGVKPTYGRVSRYGLVAFASSLDQVGVFGANVDYAARAMEVIAGPDPRDSTSADRPVPPLRFDGTQRLDGVVIGRPREYFPDSLDPRMRERLDAALDALRERGAEVKEVSLEHTDLAIPVYYIVATAEASSNLARFDGVRYGLRVEGNDGLKGMYEATRSRGFGPEVTRRILLGTYVLSAGYYDAYYRKAQQVRTLIARDFGNVFDQGVDVIFTPTTPTPAFEIGAKAEPYEMYLNDIFTATVNLAGVPAISVPVGTIDGLPVGAQLIARHFEEDRMFRVAYVLENALGAMRGAR